MRNINWPIFFIGTFWGCIETDYFGWNATPGSVAELFADGMVLAFYALAWATPWKPKVTVNFIAGPTSMKEQGR